MVKKLSPFIFSQEFGIKEENKKSQTDFCTDRLELSEVAMTICDNCKDCIKSVFFYHEFQVEGEIPSQVQTDENKQN